MEKIINYLVSECDRKPAVAATVAAPLEKHDDIRAELENWIDTREFPKDGAVTVEGYTAEAIFGLAPFMNGVGLYNFLITLRERPDNGKRIIAEGFKRK